MLNKGPILFETGVKLCLRRNTVPGEYTIPAWWKWIREFECRYETYCRSSNIVVRYNACRYQLLQSHPGDYVFLPTDLWALQQCERICRDEYIQHYTRGLTTLQARMRNDHRRLLPTPKYSCLGVESPRPTPVRVIHPVSTPTPVSTPAPVSTPTPVSTPAPVKRPRQESMSLLDAAMSGKRECRQQVASRFTRLVNHQYYSEQFGRHWHWHRNAHFLITAIPA